MCDILLVFREMLHGIDDLSSTWLTRIRINILYLGLGHPNCRLWLKALGKELVERKVKFIDPYISCIF